VFLWYIERWMDEGINTPIGRTWSSEREKEHL